MNSEKTKLEMRRAKLLLSEAFTCQGMLEGITAKCKILTAKLKDPQFSKEEARKSFRQMKADFDIYSRRFLEIREELDDYEIFARLF